MMTSDSRKRAAEAERESQSPPAPVDVGEGRRLLAAMTDGEWQAYGDGVVGFSDPGTGLIPTATSDRDALQRARDAQGIAWLVNNATALLDAAEERDRLRAGIEEVLADWKRLRTTHPEPIADAELRACSMDLRALLSPEDQS